MIREGNPADLVLIIDALTIIRHFDENEYKLGK